MNALRPELATMLRLLTFRASRDDLRGLNRRHLVLGLCATWLIGVGRWWEDPRAGLLQHLGIGSVIYVFILAFFLWLILWPMKPECWSYLNVLTFISLTSLPGILYAIPVRHGLDLYTAQQVRLWFLAVVSGWRVSLLFFYLGRGAGLFGFKRFVAASFPLVFVVFGLTALNLEKVVFDIMGGIHPEARSVNDDAYGGLFLITAVSFYLFIPLFLWYAAISGQTLSAKVRRDKSEQHNSTIKNTVDKLGDDSQPRKLCVSCRAPIPMTAKLCSKCGWTQPV
jgi:hypothetical protein